MYGSHLCAQNYDPKTTEVSKSSYCSSLIELCVPVNTSFSSVPLFPIFDAKKAVLHDFMLADNFTHLAVLCCWYDLCSENKLGPAT